MGEAEVGGEGLSVVDGLVDPGVVLVESSRDVFGCGLGKGYGGHCEWLCKVKEVSVNVNQTAVMWKSYIV